MEAPIAVVLAAGKGTRMNSDKPKVLCQAAGKSLVRYVIEALRQAGVGKIVVVVGYQADAVEEHLADVPGLEFALQAEQLGTGHAVMMCRPQLAQHRGPVVVVAGDSPMMQASSIQALLDEFRSTQPACLLGTLRHSDPTGLGRIVRDADGNFVGIVEHKDATPEQRAIDEVNMSTYVFDGPQMLAALDHLNTDNQQNEYYLTDLPAILLSAGQQVQALPVLQPIEALSVNTPDQLAEVERVLLESRS